MNNKHPSFTRFSSFYPFAPEHIRICEVNVRHLDNSACHETNLKQSRSIDIEHPF